MDFHLNGVGGGDGEYWSSTANKGASMNHVVSFTKAGLDGTWRASNTDDGATTGTRNFVAQTNDLVMGFSEGASDFPGDIYEIIVYNQALSTADRISVTNYLLAKYCL